MQIVVICGGLATRLYPTTKTIPKSMIRIAGKPFLEHQIKLFKKNGIFDIVLCTGNFSEQIEEYFGDGKKFGVNIRYSREKEPLDTGGALRNAKNLLGEEFFTIYGDSYLLCDYQEVYRHFKKFNKLGLMTVCKEEEKLGPGNVVIEGDLVKTYDKENLHQPGMNYIEYGLNVFKKAVLGLVDKKVFPIGDYFKELIQRKELLGLIIPQRFYEMGSSQSLAELKAFIENVDKKP